MLNLYHPRASNLFLTLKDSWKFLFNHTIPTKKCIRNIKKELIELK